MTKLLFKIPISVFLLFGFLFLVQDSYASILYLSPGNGNITQGGTKAVVIRLSGQGDTVNGVSAVLSYPQDKLEVSSISYEGTAFAIAAEGSAGGGTVRVSRANFSGVSGDVNVATINFRGKGLGSATVTFNGGSAAPRSTNSSDSLNLGASRGATFTVGGVAPAATPAPVKAGAPTPTPVKPLLIESIKVENISSDSATISWTTSAKTSSYITYGLEKDNYIINLPKDTALTSHSTTITGPLLTPGGTFHFRVKAIDSLANEWSSDDNIFQLPGYQLTVTVTDSISRPLAGASAELFGYNQKLTTDQSGQVVFKNLLPGRQLLIVRVGDQEKTQEISLDESPMAQSYNFQVAGLGDQALSSTPDMKIIITLAALSVLLVIIVAVFLLRRKKSHQPTNPVPPTHQTPG